jgi:hypothetical protein
VVVLSTAYAASAAQTLSLWLNCHLERSSMRAFCVFWLISRPRRSARCPEGFKLVVGEVDYERQQARGPNW